MTYLFRLDCEPTLTTCKPFSSFCLVLEMDSQTYQEIKYFLFHNINIFLFELLSPYIYTVQKIYSTPVGYRTSIQLYCTNNGPLLATSNHL